MKKTDTIKPSTQLDHHTVPGLKCTDESRTQQQYLHDTDINNILANYEREGLPSDHSGRQPIFGDFSDERIGDFRAALDAVQGVNDLMMDLPAKVRARFKNNPQEIFAFIADPANRTEAIELGLVEPPAEPARTAPETKPETK